MSDLIDRFMAELRAAGLDRAPPDLIEDTEDALRRLQMSPMMIADHDRVCDIIRQRRPLLERIDAIRAVMQEGLESEA